MRLIHFIFTLLCATNRQVPTPCAGMVGIDHKSKYRHLFLKQVCLLLLVGFSANAHADYGTTSRWFSGYYLHLGYFNTAGELCAAVAIAESTPMHLAEKSTGNPYGYWCRGDINNNFAYGLSQEYICPRGGYVGYNADGTGKCYCPPTSDGVYNEFYKATVQNCVGASPEPKKPGADPKTNGKQCPKCDVGDPINPSIGNNWRTETDYSSNSLSFTRTYNSNSYSPDAGEIRPIGTQWTHMFERRTQPIPDYLVTHFYECYRWNDDHQLFCLYPTWVPRPSIAVSRPDGKMFAFRYNGTKWIASGDVKDRLSVNYAADGVTINAVNYVSADGDQKEVYDGSRRLLSNTSRSGQVQTFTYSDGLSNNTANGRIPANAPVCPNVQAGTILPAGVLLCVTDAWGRQLQFEYDSNSRVSKMITPDSQVYLYEYDGPSGGCPTADVSNSACFANNLTKVTYPDGKFKTYWYNEAAQINGGVLCTNFPGVGNGFGSLLNALTSMVDENGSRYVSWNYNCAGQAIANKTSGGVNQTLALGTPDATTGASTTIVTSSYGPQANPQITSYQFSFQVINDVPKVSAVSQPCAECGTASAYTYDFNGNISTSKDWNGITTTYTYDFNRNLETQRVEASGTPQARTITTSWHATYRLPLKIAEPLRRTTYTYDANGNVLTRTVQATTDANGALGFSGTLTGTARKWTYTYNTLGQVLTVTGPRTDVVDKTSYSYDTQGNLSTVTNAAGHITTLSAYDANGRVGRIVDPNGVITDLSYTPRGWLASRTTNAGGLIEATSYTYDGVGQLIGVSLPDNSSISYTYDDAHRLTKIQDSLGNRINYTLDNVGNRINETVTDTSGALKRQVSRVYDALNRLQQVTGGAQ